MRELLTGSLLLDYFYKRIDVCQQPVVHACKPDRQLVQTAVKILEISLYRAHHLAAGFLHSTVCTLKLAPAAIMCAGHPSLPRRSFDAQELSERSPAVLVNLQLNIILPPLDSSACLPRP
mmetsp:Transcript_25084/g.82735  ORF Transcript_25084/g.82735 Transcript_25084/m.82735 type:complete len:120 (+) Transcript_25084:1114-1473(+)